MLPSMISSYNERFAKQYETNAIETLQWDFTEANDQCLPRMLSESQLSQAKTNINENGTVLKCKERTKVGNNGRLNSKIHTCDVQ